MVHVFGGEQDRKDFSLADTVSHGDFIETLTQLPAPF